MKGEEEEGGRLASSDPGTVAQTNIECLIRREQLYKRNKSFNRYRVGRQEAAARVTLKPFEILEELPHVMHCSCWDHLGEMQNLAPTHPCRDRILGSPQCFL
jgi:hypothetical protein